MSSVEFYAAVLVDWVPYALAVAVAVGGLIGFALSMLRATTQS